MEDFLERLLQTPCLAGLHMKNDNPYVSYCLITYNQEKYIAGAIRSALAQTYSNIQFVISDDHSSDGTVREIEDTLGQVGDPRKIVIRKGGSNLGLADHLNEVFKLAEGEFIVMAAGDDLSFPHRTETLVNEWIRIGKANVLFHSRALPVDADGRPCQLPDGTCCVSPFRHSLNSAVDIVNNMKWVLGATEAFDARLVRSFPPINSRIVNEDAVLTFRASLRDGIVFIDDDLIKYRIGMGVGADVLRANGRIQRYRHYQKQSVQISAISRQYLVDFEVAGSRDEQLLRSIRLNNWKCEILMHGHHLAFFKGLWMCLNPRYIWKSPKILIRFIAAYLRASLLRIRPDSSGA
jgi:glycosyltransferase involved in cell wall biosynthesis